MYVAIGSEQLGPPVFLAPLAGITDRPFRALVKRFGAGLVVSEMVASGEMLTGRPLARARAELGADVEGTSVQIAGCEARAMADCARLVADMGARIIDINFGCPAKKVTNGLSGSALMRDPDHALSLIEAVIGAVDVPVTVKMRLGWDDASLNAAEIAVRAEAAGVSMVTVHGRTRCQFYKGKADWAAIRTVVEAASIPVIANGDIRSAGDAAHALRRSGAAGVMVGRGAQGRPWALADIAHALGWSPAPKTPYGMDFIDMISEHYEDMLTHYGPELGARCARKHLGWYMDHLGTDPVPRRKILTERDPGAVLSQLRTLDAYEVAA